MARRSQCSSAGDNPLDPNYLPPHYREEYRLAIDALVEEDLEGYYQFLQKSNTVDFLSTPEIQYIQSSVQDPQHSSHPELPFLETGGDGSSDTYWPVHSDLDVPDLDLGWPQLHHFIGPTEVTTLVNPPEPDMPSIKEQARRLIKNAQQVIAIVMDMFTDVDIFADILNAAMRNVAVYILLDQQNAHHFTNMVSSCRVNLQSIQFVRVRTVSGISYQCRSGKTFKGQMMDRFLLTDCRAVLSGNYSFMWSFEKLHRCMAHLFLGQLVTTFDEEFRILFAQSQPLIIENVLPPMEDLSLTQKRQYPSDRTAIYRDTRKFLSLDTGPPDEWARHSYEERMEGDWRMKPLKRQESLRGPADMYSRFPPQQSRMDPPFDQGPSRIPMMDNPAFKRYSYAEGSHGRYPFLQQQGMPDTEPQGRHFHRGQQPYPGPGPGPGPGPEADYSGYDKFWNQDFNTADQHPEPGLPQDIPQSDNFDPIRNYLSSTRNLDFDQSSDKLPPAADLPFSSLQPRRLSLGQPYACQTSPTPSNPTDQKQFFQEPPTDRKDPMVKRGLRSWRISSYLSANDNPDDEDLPMAPLQAPDPFEQPSIPIQPTPGIDLTVPKIPNVREFKVPAIPRASQIPNYAKTAVREQPKKLPDEPATLGAETKTTPTPSESSSTTEVEKTEEAEQKETTTAAIQRGDSFRRKYNAAVPRSSRLRSSLIFSSLDQQAPQDTKTAAPDQQDEEGDKNEAEPTKLAFVSQVLGQRRSAREPFEWSRYKNSSTFDNSSTETSKPDDGGSKSDSKDASKEEKSKDLSQKPATQEPLKLPDVEQINPLPSVPQSKPSEVELPKTDQPVQPPRPLLPSSLFVDMSDPDNRLQFFKELAAKRKAAKAAEAEKSKEKPQVKPLADLKTEEPLPKETTASTSEGVLEKNASAEGAGETTSTETCETVSQSLDTSEKSNKQDSVVKTSKSCKAEQTKVSAGSEMKELEDNQSAVTLPLSSQAEVPQSKSPHLSNPAVKESSHSHPPTPTDAAPADVSSLAQGTDESESPSCDSTSKESNSVTPSSLEEPSSSVLGSDTQNTESVQLETSICSPPSEKDTGSEIVSSNAPVQSSSSDHTLQDSGSQNSADSLSSSLPLPSTTEDPKSSTIIPEDSSSTPASNILSPNLDKTEPQESVTPSLQESSQSSEETSQKSENLSHQTHLDSVAQLSSSETPPAVESTNVESDSSPDACAAGSEPNESSLESTTKATFEDVSAATPSAKESEMDTSESDKDVSESETHSLPKTFSDKSKVLASSEEVEDDSTSRSLTPSTEPGLLSVSVLESSTSKPDLKETLTPTATPEDTAPKQLPSETSSAAGTDLTPDDSQSETTASPQDTPVQATPPSDLKLTGVDAPTPPKELSCSFPLSESVESVLSPEAKKQETNLSASQTLSNTNSLPSETPSETDKSLLQASTKSPSSPTEPTSEVPTDSDLPSKTPESVTSESNTSEQPDENSKTEPEVLDTGEKKSDTKDTNKIDESSTQDSVSSDKTNDQVKQNNCSESTEITSKQPKSSQSRYHSSTANVLSSSNLRDDTKLLLEQISANSQSRNEATKELPITKESSVTKEPPVTKESPVTDDEKEDEADKNAKKEKDRGYRTFSRVPAKPTPEREKLLEKIQSMRKERKVYSRFEMAP